MASYLRAVPVVFLVVSMGCGEYNESAPASRGDSPSMAIPPGAAPGVGIGRGGAEPSPREGGAFDGDLGGGSSGSSVGGGSGQVEAGLLTSGAWDDNLNFGRFTDFRTEMVTQEPTALPSFTSDEQAAANARFATRSPNLQLDVALVVDTTGSMSDEIAYLKAELADIAQAVQAGYPGAATRWALIVYRDEGDEYVTRSFDFTSDVEAYRASLAAQFANGGGDYPEASHQALVDMTNLDWRAGGEVARLAFWVADAPHHAQHAGTLTEAVRTAAQLDVHLYPVASSGVDRVTEYSMRASSQLTGGRYLFLTDDSGIGGAHLEPTIPCYFVTLLNDAMLRMIDIEMTGVYREPTPEQVIRTGGDPMDGACILDSGQTVTVF